MSDLSIQQLENVATAYNELLAPALFQEWTHRVADAAELRPGQRVLDVACGTGILARVAAGRVAPTGSVSGLDINPGMLSVAERISPEIDWREGPADSLPYEDQFFDAVVSQFGLMFFPKPESALREMVRVLKPGGHLAVAVFDSLDNMPAYAAMAYVFDRLFGKEIGNALRFPFSMGDTEELASLFAAAGIRNAVVNSQEGTAYFPGVRDMVLADVKGWFPFAQINLDENMIEAVVNEAEKVLEPFRTSNDAVEFRVPVHIITATRS